MDVLHTAGTLQVGGLPLHPLIVHATVILVPLTALALLLGTYWPTARRRLGIVTPLAALVVLVLVPVTVAAGESLAAQVGPLPGVDRHAGFGRMLLPWAIGMFAVAAGQWAWYRWVVTAAAHPSTRVRAGTVVLGALATAVGIGIVVMVVVIGESGARAVWGSG